MIADDGVEQELVGPVAAAGRAAEGPDVVDDRAEHQRAFIRAEESYRRAGAPFIDADGRVGHRRIVQQRTHAPIETLSIAGRQEKCRVSVVETGGPMIT